MTLLGFSELKGHNINNEQIGPHGHNSIDLALHIVSNLFIYALAGQFVKHLNLTPIKVAINSSEPKTRIISTSFAPKWQSSNVCTYPVSEAGSGL
jgi:hypothetical protein